MFYFEKWLGIPKRSGYSHRRSANNLSDAPYSHSRSVYCHHSLASLQSGRQLVKVPDLYHVIPCRPFQTINWL